MSIPALYGQQEEVPRLVRIDCDIVDLDGSDRAATMRPSAVAVGPRAGSCAPVIGAETLRFSCYPK